MMIFGEDVYVGDEIYINGGVVLLYKEIKFNILKLEIVMWYDIYVGIFVCVFWVYFFFFNFVFLVIIIGLNKVK